MSDNENFAIINKLTVINEILRDIRDNQKSIPCINDDICICNRFDLIIDSIENLIKEFE